MCALLNSLNTNAVIPNTTKMSEQPQNLRGLFTSADRARQELASSHEANSPAFQENLRQTIATYEECLKVSKQISLFSPNESLEDISSSDLQYVYCAWSYLLKFSVHIAISWHSSWSEQVPCNSPSLG
jgi:hypothetical protein